MKIKKDDKVVVLSGKDKGKQGKVLIADPKGGKVVVEGVNVATKHQKPRKQGEEGGIIKVSTPIYVSKLALYCPDCKKGVRVKKSLNGDKKIKNLPKPGANDDPELSAKAYNDFKEMKKLMKSTVSAQRSRLEYVLMCDRKWSADNWKKLFVRNPLMHCFAVGLIWGVYDDNGLSASFRYLDDGSFTTSDEDEFEIPDNASIGLVHPIELSADELAVWKEQLSDYEITQPFPQLDRTVFHITDEEKSMTDITRFNDRELNGLAFAGKMLKFGWFKGTAEDAGMFYYFYRTDSPKSGESYTAELKFSGMYIEVFYDESDDVSVETLSFYTIYLQKHDYDITLQLPNKEP